MWFRNYRKYFYFFRSFFKLFKPLRIWANIISYVMKLFYFLVINETTMSVGYGPSAFIIYKTAKLTNLLSSIYI